MKKIANASGALNTIPQKRAFCIAMQKNKKIMRIDSDSPDEFKDALKMPAWHGLILS